MKSLDDILSDEPDAVEPVEEQKQPETEAKQEPAPETAEERIARDEKGRFAPKDEAPTDRLPPEEYKALKEERTKRQKLEAELAELQRLNAAPQAPPPSIWEDDAAWQQHFGTEVVTTAVSQATHQSRLAMSEMLMAQQTEDFTSVKEQLVEFVGQNPAINQQVAASPHPWHTAYQAFKNQQRIAELGATDVQSLEQKIREQLLAEMQAGNQPPARPGLPPTLSGQPSVANRSGPAWTGPTSLDDILR